MDLRRIVLRAILPFLLPKTIAWAEEKAQQVASSGRTLTDQERWLARGVGVAKPETVRISLVDTLPLPESPVLRTAALQAGLLTPDMVGLTLGYSVFVRKGCEDLRILSHEFRHVYQYEQAGSIAAFLPGYLKQVVQFGYSSAAFEKDARAHERDNS